MGLNAERYILQLIFPRWLIFYLKWRVVIFLKLNGFIDWLSFTNGTGILFTNDAKIKKIYTCEIWMILT